MIGELFTKCVHSIRQISNDNASQRAWYRFLRNTNTTEAEITKQITDQCAYATKGRVVLSIQDTTEINLYSHKNRISHDEAIGKTNASRYGLGFLMHPSFVIDAWSGFPFGYSDVKIWNRSNDKSTKHDRKYLKLPIQEKESYRWIEASFNTQKTLSEAERIIIVQDREGDIYEQFATVPDKKTDLLVRAKSNRVLEGGEKLFDKVSASEVAGTYSINLEGDKRKNQEKRSADLEVRFCSTTLKRPASASKEVKDEVSLYIIEAREINSNSKSLINWKLLTTCPITNIEDALLVIQWYSWRWMIEEVFRILKKEGYNIEASELESPKAVRKLSLFMLSTITKLFQMRYCYHIPEGENLESMMCFSEQEIECLDIQCTILEGKTKKRQNPFPKESLSHVTWIIARLGGWKGYKSERPPGITTLWIGLMRFYDIFEGWKMYKDVYTR